MSRLEISRIRPHTVSITVPLVPIELRAIQVTVNYYVARWTIKKFFRVFKTGCQIEKIQLETLSRLKVCLAFYKIIAWLTFGPGAAKTYV